MSPPGPVASARTATSSWLVCGDWVSRRSCLTTLQSPVIVTVLVPDRPGFRLDVLNAGLRDRGFVIFPGKLTSVDSFRVGCIGDVGPTQMAQFVEAAAVVLRGMG